MHRSLPFSFMPTRTSKELNRPSTGDGTTLMWHYCSAITNTFTPSKHYVSFFSYSSGEQPFYSSGVFASRRIVDEKQEGSEYIPTWFVYLSIHFHVARLFSSLFEIHTHASGCCFADYAAFNSGTSPHTRQRHQIIIQHPAKAIPMLPNVIRLVK